MRRFLAGRAIHLVVIPGLAARAPDSRSSASLCVSGRAYLPIVARHWPTTPAATPTATPIPPFAAYAVAIPDDGPCIDAFLGDLPPDYDDQLSMIESFECMTGRRLAIVADHRRQAGSDHSCCCEGCSEVRPVGVPAIGVGQ
jgi:hypothetical protein